MSEELHDVRLRVNGATHAIRVPARRLLSDALRHDCGLTGTHVGCEHGVCGACTVLLDGRPVRSCLMLAVSAQDVDLTTVEGLTEPDGSLSPVQQAFSDCHGLQCGFCTPGLPHHDRRWAPGHARPDRGRRARHDRGQPVPLHRLPEHREVRAAGRRDHSGALVTTKLFGTRVPRVEDQRFLRGQGRYVDDVLVGQRVLHAAVLRSPHAHARITDIDVSDVLDVDGVHLVWTHDDLTGPMAEPLPLLIPHPALVHGRTQFALAPDEVNYVGEAIAFVVAEDRYVAEDAVARIRVSYEYLEPVVGIAAARAAPRPRARRRARQRRRSARAGERRRPRRDRGRSPHAHPRPHHRAVGLPADGGPRHRRPLGPRPRPDDGVDLDPDLDRRPRLRRGEARARPRPGRRDHPRRRRRLRREDQPPVARGAARPARRSHARRPREVHRGPARALHLVGARARAGAPRRGRASTTTAGCSASTWSSGTTTAPTRRTA